jgi:lipid-binding SYLF domain-containing protein
MRATPFSIAVLLCVLTASPWTASASSQTDKVQTSINVLNEFMHISDEGMPESLLRNAYGIAIIPDVIKVGFVVGGRFGRGILLVRTPSGGWSNPTFITITGGSLGYQIGAQSTDVILVFKTPKSIDGIVRGKFTLGADAAVAAGPVGRRGEAATDAQLKAEIYSYARSRGLFAGVSLEGSALQIDYDANERFYGRGGMSARDVFAGKGIRPPPVVQRLKAALARYTKAPGSTQ